MKLAPWRRGKADRSFKNKFWLRVFWILAFLGMGGFYSFYFRADIFNWLLAPADGQLSPHVVGFDGKPVYGKLTGMIEAIISIVAKGAFLFAMPAILYSVLSLIKPWMSVRFWRFLTYVTLSIVVSYLAGGAFVYYVMLPIGIGFLLGIGSDIATPLIDIADYLALLTALMSAMGMVFLIPTMMFLFSKLVRFPKYRHWKWGRWVVPFFAGFLGMILTPSTDTVNYLMIGLPVIGLYEIGMFATWVIAPEEGNYLWFWTIYRGLRKVRDGVVWVLRRPVVMKRWMCSKIYWYGEGWVW